MARVSRACVDRHQVFVLQSPALRGQAVSSDAVYLSESPGRSDLQAGAFAGSSIELAAVESPVVLKARRASGRKASNGSQHTTAPPGSARASPQRCNAAGSSWLVWNTGIILPAPRRLSVLPAWQVELNRRRSRALASGWVMLTLFLGPSRALISASRRTSLYWGLLLICILSARGLNENLSPRERQAPAATAASSGVSIRCSSPATSSTDVMVQAPQF